ncbi:hypothetical protein WK56_23630 [Burkholderia ubonensis]|nr:hypothetical protein WK56_23630 [Burkholderia ubonensis]
MSARTTAPCLSGIDYTAADQKNTNTYVIGLTITDTVGDGVNVTVGPIKFGASREHETENANKLTVTFRQINLETLPVIKSAVHYDPKTVPFFSAPLRSGSASQSLINQLFAGNVTTVAADGRKKKDASGEPEISVFTFCRDADYFMFWCINKTQKVEFGELRM